MTEVPTWALWLVGVISPLYLVQRGEAMIAYLSSLPDDILPVEEKDLLLAMMTVGVARGAAYPGVIESIEPAMAEPPSITEDEAG